MTQILKDKLSTSIGPKIDLGVITFFNPSDHVLSLYWTKFPQFTPLTPSQGGQTPHSDIPKIQILQIIWENTCCDFIFQPIFKNNSFLERAKFALAFKNVIMYSYYGKISIFAQKV